MAANEANRLAAFVMPETKEKKKKKKLKDIYCAAAAASAVAVALAASCCRADYARKNETGRQLIGILSIFSEKNNSAPYAGKVERKNCQVPGRLHCI